MAKKPLPCPTVLRQQLRYEPETGKLFWRTKRPWMVACQRESTRVRIAKNWNARYSGAEAFPTIGQRGALTGSVNTKRLYAHRVAWAIYHGAWPVGEVDHINGNQLDNRMENLRDVTSSENSQNTSVYSSNKTGHHGVWWDAARNKYQAYITKEGKRTRLGRFAKIEDAIAAREAAEEKLGFHANHGRLKTTQLGDASDRRTGDTQSTPPPAG